MHRREFLRLAALSAAGILLPGCAGRRPEFDFTLEQSVGYLVQEIRSYPGIECLNEYGDEEKILSFVSHAYNVYALSTGSSSDVRTLQEATRLGNNLSIEETLSNEVYGEQVGSSDMYQARTYPTDPGLQNSPYSKNIIINREARGFCNSGVNMHGGSKVLTVLAEVASHEPFHFDSPIKDIDRVYQAAVSRFHYVHQSGFALYGNNLNTEEKVIHFATLDELATRYIHRRLVGEQIPDVKSNYSEGEIVWTDIVASEIFRPLGFTSAAEIMRLQRGGGFMSLLERLTAMFNGDEQEAYLSLVELNNKLFEATGLS